MSERLCIVLGVTGSIAAYKACEVASTLHQRGHEVHVVMTEAATRLVSPATFYPLTGNPVHWDLWDPEATRGGARVEHVGLADRADIFVLAPATANTIGKIAHGLADDFLTTLLLAYAGPVLVAPAMNDVMYAHPAVQRNLATLRAFGYRFVDPEEGALACGRSGVGRLAAPLAIVEAAIALGHARRAVPGAGRVRAAAPPGAALPRPLRVLVTSGPTREWLDDVRVLTNASSGRMGDAIAAELAARGHDVTLVRGPVDRPAPAGCRVVAVESTDAMRDACVQVFASQDALVMAAAPCDFRPAERLPGKLKKRETKDAVLAMRLEPTPDILRELGAARRPDQVLMGFALEAANGLENALAKLREKRLDRIVLNGPQNLGVDGGAQATLVGPDGPIEELCGTKAEIARALVGALESAAAPRIGPARSAERET